MSDGFWLDRNERAIPFSENLLSKLSHRLKEIPLNLYPNVDPLYKKLAGFLNLSQNELYITEGVSGAIKALVETIANPGDNIVCPVPTFALYPVYAQMFQVEFRSLSYQKDYRLNLDQLKSLVDDKTSMVFLPNPNVPIEGTISEKELETLAQFCQDRNIYLIVDEVYYYFGGPSALPSIKKFENVLVVRSFSKAFGLAGVRVGFIAGNERMIDYVSKTRTGYETNSLSSEVIQFYIENFSEIKTYIDEVKQGLNYLKQELNLMKIENNGGETSNFLYINLKSKDLVNRVTSHLKNKNFFIRANWPIPFDQGLSITGAPMSVMKPLVEELKIILNKGK